MNDLTTRIETALAAPARPSSDFDLNPDIAGTAGRALRPASVLIAIYDGHIILTKRASGLQHHPGQIAFPGGKVDASDAGPRAAALREAHEEVGLDPATVRILGALPHHETVTGFHVAPFVAMLTQDFDPIPEQGEVAEVFRVPIAHVLDQSAYHIQARRWQGRMRHYYTIPYGPYYIWGATARILRSWSDLMQ